MNQAKVSRLQDFSDSQSKRFGGAGGGEGRPAALAAEHFTLHERANDVVTAKCNAIRGGAVSWLAQTTPAWRQELAVPAPHFEGLDFMFSA